MIRLGICFVLVFHLILDKRVTDTKAERPIYSQTIEATV